MESPQRAGWIRRHDAGVERMNQSARLRYRQNETQRFLERMERLHQKADASDKPHGTRARKLHGCRCMLCRAADSRYETNRKVQRKAGHADPLVSPRRAKRHIDKLSTLGVGQPAIAEACGVGRTNVGRIKRGLKHTIRKSTETKILSVTADAAADGAYIDARPTWEKIAELLEEGFTKVEIARRIGKKRPALELSKTRVRASSAAMIDRLYRTVMAE